MLDLTMPQLKKYDKFQRSIKLQLIIILERDYATIVTHVKRVVLFIFL